MTGITGLRRVGIWMGVLVLVLFGRDGAAAEDPFEGTMKKLVRDLTHKLDTGDVKPVIIVHGFVNSEDRERLAFSNVLEDELVARLANQNVLTVIRKAKLEEALKTRSDELKDTDPTAADYSRRVANIVGAKVFITGTYQEWGETLKIRAMIVNTESGEITATIAAKTPLTAVIRNLLGEGGEEGEVVTDAAGKKTRKARFTIDARSLKNVRKYFDIFAGVDDRYDGKPCLHMFAEGRIESKWRFVGDFRVAIRGGLDVGLIRVCGVEFSFWRGEVPDAEGYYYLERRGNQVALAFTKRKNLFERKKIPPEHRNAATRIVIGDKGYKRFGSTVTKISVQGTRIVDE